MRKECCARGAAQKVSNSHADCRSGSWGSSSRRCWCSCSRASRWAAMYSGDPRGVPTATKPRAAGSQSLHQTAGPKSAKLAGAACGKDPFIIPTQNFQNKIIRQTILK